MGRGRVVVVTDTGLVVVVVAGGLVVVDPGWVVTVVDGGWVVASFRCGSDVKVDFRTGLSPWSRVGAVVVVDAGWVILHAAFVVGGLFVVTDFVCLTAEVPAVVFGADRAMSET